MQDVVFFISEHILLISIWSFCFIAVIFFTTRNLSLKSKIINNIQAIELINHNQAIVIDTRSLELFKERHIINSINMPSEKILSGDVKEIQIHKSSPIILILNATYQDKKCVQEFLKYGFKHVYILKNGIYNWHLDHLPLVVQDE